MIIKLCYSSREGKTVMRQNTNQVLTSIFQKQDADSMNTLHIYFYSFYLFQLLYLYIFQLSYI